MEEGCSITRFDAVLMVCVALFYDLVQLAINIVMFGFGFLVTWIISLWAWLTFYLWFRIKGVSFMNLKNALKLTGGGLIEIIPFPFLSALPAWTAVVIALIFTNAPWAQRVTHPTKNYE